MEYNAIDLATLSTYVRETSMDVTHAVVPSETLADRVRRLRLGRHMSRIELAYAAGVSKSHVHQIERGERTRMRLTTLARYAHALGVPESYIDYGYGTERTGASERQTDLTEMLRQATQLEYHQIQHLVGLVRVLEEENARCQAPRRTVASDLSVNEAQLGWSGIHGHQERHGHVRERDDCLTGRQAGQLLPERLVDATDRAFQ